MKKNYLKPEIEVFAISTTALLQCSIEGGEIGGTTDRFDAPARRG